MYQNMQGLNPILTTLIFIFHMYVYNIPVGKEAFTECYFLKFLLHDSWGRKLVAWIIIFMKDIFIHELGKLGEMPVLRFSTVDSRIPVLHSIHIWVGTALIHIHGCTACAVDFSRGFWYGTLPCPMTFKGAKLLTASTSAVEWYMSRAHT